MSKNNGINLFGGQQTVVFKAKKKIYSNFICRKIMKN